MKAVSEIILKTMGWKLVGEFPNLKKSVVVLAPHTSNWDFVFGRLYLDAKGIGNYTLMKKEMFFFPLNVILKALGAIPVDRKTPKINIVSQLSSIIMKSDKFNLFIAPEGTRKKTMKEINDVYVQISAKHPENFSLDKRFN